MLCAGLESQSQVTAAELTSVYWAALSLARGSARNKNRQPIHEVQPGKTIVYGIYIYILYNVSYWVDIRIYDIYIYIHMRRFPKIWDFHGFPTVIIHFI